MNTDFLYFGLAGLICVVGVILLIRNAQVAKTWRAGLQQIAQTHRLRHVQPQGAISAIYDLVTGETGGYSVTINIDSVSRYGSDSETRYMAMEVAGGSRGNLKIGPPGAFDQPGVTDYSNENTRVELGDPAFDAAVELRAPPKVLLEALRNDSALREELMQFVNDGLVVESCDTRIRTREFPKTAALYLQQFERLLAFARRLDNLLER
jgi:hypothetical protein